jgi:N-formylmaleamate deformylase
MQDWKQGQVFSDEHSLRYLRSGGNRPTLVMVHGFTDHALYFTRVADALAKRWDVIAYDARGHGQSDRSRDLFDDATRVRDLVEVIDQLELDRPALLGHSMGAATIAQTIAAFPQLSRGAILEDPAWWEPTDEEIVAGHEARIQRLKNWRDWVAAIHSKSKEEALAQRRIDEPTWAELDLDVNLEGRRTFQLDLFDHFPLPRAPWRSVVSDIGCPTLLMIGDDIGRGRIISRETADEAQTLNPLITVAEIAGAGHHLKYDAFDAFMRAVSAFLEPLQ